MGKWKHVSWAECLERIAAMDAEGVTVAAPGDCPYRMCDGGAHLPCGKDRSGWPKWTECACHPRGPGDVDRIAPKREWVLP